MKILFRSVVGKLWMTIIALVTVVLLLLSVLLIQFFDRFYYDGQYEHLKTMANKVAYIFETYEDKGHAVQTAKELAEVSDTRLVVLGPSPNEIWEVAVNQQVPHLNIEQIFSDQDLIKVFEGQPIEKRAHFPLEQDRLEDNQIEVMIVGVPLISNGEQSGAVYLYQTLDVVNQTIDYTKKLIGYAAGIGFILTTVFAFFLSTRITHPLRQMKVAANSIAQGDFQNKVSIRSKDEIGDLALTFNHMAKHLNESIHALSQEKEQLSNILRSMVDGVITLDIHGKVILTNPPAEKMLHTWKFEEGTEYQAAVPKRLSEIFKQVIKTEKEHVSHISAQGRFWTIAMSPLTNQDYIRGAVAVIRDMTEENRLDKLRKDFIANVSHELRTPLSMMQGYSEALVDDIVSTPEERKEIAQIIYDESIRMGRLVNELLDLARMETGRVQLQLSPISLGPIIQKSVRKFSNFAKEEQVHLLEDIQSTSKKCYADTDRIEQIMTNLIDNALRHTPAHGQITVSMAVKGDFFQIDVQDTGSGIPTEDLPFIFERFYKADKARTRGRSGTGLGLSIVKHLVEEQEGQIQVYSKWGEGTTFSIQLPVYDQS